MITKLCRPKSKVSTDALNHVHAFSLAYQPPRVPNTRYNDLDIRASKDLSAARNDKDDQEISKREWRGFPVYIFHSPHGKNTKQRRAKETDDEKADYLAKISAKSRNRGKYWWANMTDEEREIVRAKRRIAMNAKTDEEKANIAAKMASTWRAYYTNLTDEDKEAIRAKKSKAMKAKHAKRLDEEREAVRAKISEQREAVRAKKSKALKAYQANLSDEQREAFRAKTSKAMKAYHANLSDEQKASRAAKMSATWAKKLLHRA